MENKAHQPTLLLHGLSNIKHHSLGALDALLDPEWVGMNGRDDELVRAIGKERPWSSKVQQAHKKNRLSQNS